MLQPALQHSQMSRPAHENKLSLTMLGQLYYVAELCCFMVHSMLSSCQVTCSPENSFKAGQSSFCNTCKIT